METLANNSEVCNRDCVTAMEWPVMERANNSGSFGDNHDKVNAVVKEMEEHYRKLFNLAYTEALEYARVIAKLHQIRIAVNEQRQISELERWFRFESNTPDGGERNHNKPGGDPETN